MNITPKIKMNKKREGKPRNEDDPKNGGNPKTEVDPKKDDFDLNNQQKIPQSKNVQCRVYFVNVRVAKLVHLLHKTLAFGPLPPLSYTCKGLHKLSLLESVLFSV